jgi:hypothetical protein
MKFITILSISTFLTLSIIVIKDIFKEVKIIDDNNKERITQTSQEAVDLVNLYFMYCNDTTAISNVSTSELESTINRLNAVFQKQEALSTALENVFLTEDQIKSEDYNTIIQAIIKILAPFLLILVLVLLGWFTCCSCCCYRYCPIICKKKTKHTSTSRLIPVILVIFSGCSLIIPSILAFIKFNEMRSVSANFYCDLVNLNYVIVTYDYF